MARADIHIFGSVSGYSTIAASAGVRADETRELEQFQFGEISTSDAMSRLETQATMTSRMLASGRMAISRMLPAGVDDAGRPTIEVITLIVDARVYDAQLGALALLAEDASLWRDAREQVRTGIEYPSGAALVSEPRDPALLRVLDAWMHATRTGSVAILPANAQLDVLRFVSTLDASDRRRCRWGIGINSLSSPVDVCTMMPGASTHGARAAVRPALSGQWHCAETEFAQFRAASGGSTWIPTSQMIAGATANSVGVGGDASNSFTPDATTRGGFNEQQKRTLVISMIAATCATLLFVAAAGVYLNTSSGKKSSAVLAGGGENGSSDGGAEGGALPPLDESSRKVVWDERNTAPGAGETGAASTSETTTETPSALAASEPVKVTLVTYYMDKDGDTFGSESTRVSLDPSEKKPEHVMQGGDCDDGNKSINPRAAEACGDIGVDNNCNGDTDDVDGAETVFDWYLDEDDDGYGVSEGAIRGCSSGPPDLGQVKRIREDDSKGVDECPANPAKHLQGKCGCDWPWPEENLDGSNEPDCLDDDDCDGIKNKDEGDWKPNPARGRVLRELRRHRDELPPLRDLAMQPKGLIPTTQFDDFRTFAREVARNAVSLAQPVGAMGAAILELTKEQSEMQAKGDPAHLFVLKLWPKQATERLDDCETRTVWRAILEDTLKIVEVLEDTEKRLLKDANRFPEKGTNSKSDFTRYDARELVLAQWKDVESAFEDCPVFLKPEKLRQELDALNATEKSLGNSNNSAGAK
jgi:hypothetical protein